MRLDDANALQNPQDQARVRLYGQPVPAVSVGALLDARERARTAVLAGRSVDVTRALLTLGFTLRSARVGDYGGAYFATHERSLHARSAQGTIRLRGALDEDRTIVWIAERIGPHALVLDGEDIRGYLSFGDDPRDPAAVAFLVGAISRVPVCVAAYAASIGWEEVL